MCCHRREREGGREAFRGRLRRSSARTCVREKPEECVQEKTQPQSVSSGVCFGGADLYVWMDSQWQSGKSKGIFSRPFWEYCLEYSGYVTCSGGGGKILLQLKLTIKQENRKSSALISIEGGAKPQCLPVSRSCFCFQMYSVMSPSMLKLKFFQRWLCDVVGLDSAVRSSACLQSPWNRL